MTTRCGLHPADCGDPLCLTHGNPADLLAHHVLRPTAAALGLEVDEASVDAARAYCDQLVPKEEET